MVIKHVEKLDDEQRNQMSKLFVDGYYSELSVLSKQRDKLNVLFREAFVADAYYLAYEADQLIAMMVLCQANQSGFQLKLGNLIHSLGLGAGLMAYAHRNLSIFAKSVNHPYINCVTTQLQSRNKGIATALVQAYLDCDDKPTPQVMVQSGDETARRFLEKLGFKKNKDQINASRQKIVYMQYFQ